MRERWPARLAELGEVTHDVTTLPMSADCSAPTSVWVTVLPATVYVPK